MIRLSFQNTERDSKKKKKKKKKRKKDSFLLTHTHTDLNHISDTWSSDRGNCIVPPKWSEVKKVK